MIRRVPAPSLGAVLFFVLLALTLAIGAIVVRARTPDLALEVVDQAPTELVVNRPEAEARITFFVRKSDPAAEIGIVDRRRRVVRTLAATVPLEAGVQVTYRWDGRNDAGRRVRDGRYRLRVVLPDRGREMVWPRRITVVRAPRVPDGASGVEP